MDFLRHLSAFTPAIASISIIVAMFHFKKQMNVSIFIEYTKRYDALMDKFPENAFETRLNISELPQKSNKLTMASLKYLNLCCEEFHLFDQKLISKKIWEMWETEIIRVLRSPLFRREWDSLSNEFVSYPKFVAFVNKSHAINS